MQKRFWFMISFRIMTRILNFWRLISLASQYSRIDDFRESNSVSVFFQPPFPHFSRDYWLRDDWIYLFITYRIGLICLEDIISVNQVFVTLMLCSFYASTVLNCHYSHFSINFFERPLSTVCLKSHQERVKDSFDKIHNYQFLNNLLTSPVAYEI